MSTKQPRLEIVGFTLRGPEPLGTVHLRWSDALTVLYGANGSGKSTVLRGLEEALGGVWRRQRPLDEWHSFVYVRLMNWDAQIAVPRHAHLGSFEESWFADVDDELTRSVLDSVWSLYHTRPSDVPAEPRSALWYLENWFPYLRSGDFLALSSIGSPDEPRWHICPAYSRSSGDVERDKLVFQRSQYLYLFSLVEKLVGEDAYGPGIDVATLPIEQLIANAPVPLPDVDTYSAREVLAATFQEDTWYVDPFLYHLERLVRIQDGPGFATFLDGLAGPAWLPEVWWSDEIDAHLQGLPRPLTTGAETDRQTTVISKLIREEAKLSLKDELSPGDIIEELRPNLDEWKMKANRLREELFPLLPPLDWRAGGASAWLDGRPIEWLAEEPIGGTWISFKHLSEAQRRAYNLVLDITQADANSLLLIDEPETALDRRAVGLLAQRLNAFANVSGIPIVAATHSVEFLSQEGANLVHVAREFPSGRSRLTSVRRDELALRSVQLNLTESEILQLVRTFVVVEGEHDRLVIDGFIGDELRRVGAELVAMRGASKVVTLADAEVIFGYTDASMVVVLDAIDNPGALHEMWLEATGLARRGETRLARGRISQYRQQHPDPNYEERQILALAQQVLDRGDPSRVRFFGFTAKDIIEYLDPAAFDLETDWPSLRREYDAYKLNKSDFKTWLRLRKGAQINQDTIRAAVESVHWTDCHGEFTDLLNRAAL